MLEQPTRTSAVVLVVVVAAVLAWSDPLPLLARTTTKVTSATTRMTIAPTVSGACSCDGWPGVKQHLDRPVLAIGTGGEGVLALDVLSTGT